MIIFPHLQEFMTLTPDFISCGFVRCTYGRKSVLLTLVYLVSTLANFFPVTTSNLVYPLLNLLF